MEDCKEKNVHSRGRFSLLNKFSKRGELLPGEDVINKKEIKIKGECLVF
jgi:hypothetical protein